MNCSDRLLVAVFSAILTMYCDQGSLTGSMGVPLPTPRITVTLGFGDPPLIGSLILDPARIEDATPWNYTIDFNGDVVPDVQGVAGVLVSVPYQYEEVGPHSIGIEFQRGDQTIEFREIVVVNDVEAIEVLGAGTLATQPDRSHGIAVDRFGEFVFTTTVRQRTISRLDATSLDLLGESFVEGTGVLEGLSAAPDEDLLYSVETGQMNVLAIPQLEKLDFFDGIPGRFFVEALPSRRAYVSGWVDGISLLDTQTGQILEQINTPGITGEFAVSPNRSRIVVAILTSERRDGLALLRASDLGILWETDLSQTAPVFIPGGFPETNALAFSRDGSRIYVMRAIVGVAQWELLVLEADDGRLVHRISLGPGCDSGVSCGGAGVTAVSLDETLVAFSTGQGAVFVDRDLDLPLYRSSPSDVIIYCCGVAANPVRDEFYFNSLDFNRVTKVRIRR